MEGDRAIQETRLPPLSRRPPVTFQILSDLHLEVNEEYSQFDIPVCAKYLVLAGDVGCIADYDQYCGFIKKQTDRFELVFLVLGNHEFYKGSLAAGIEKARKLEREQCLNGKLVLLHQRRYDVPGSYVSILGCTLWSKVPDQWRDVVRWKIKDYKHIEGWTVDEHNIAHHSDVSWLKRVIEAMRNENPDAEAQQVHTRSVLAVTHHAPSLQGTSNPQHGESPWRFAFASNILEQSSTDIKTWVFGHTHYTTDFMRNGIRVVSNQRGYVHHKRKSNGMKSFDSEKVINLQ
ncbi:hypothetical protein PVAR5_5490 [Paecilomyces variotii No. 5]|uniref:Calcineurin-like phosphoesterase domain-containing protein n=1 Tax=Byssochlamys spectabilis (strain No. 5 / NBRC 109023) TaxID=1356009 RepID=V5I1Z4_BYSSN|nr:hypothetical protein PVAR5_5490 [Paecilomyces variotii No. 5]